MNRLCTCVTSMEDDAYDPGGPLSGCKRPPKCEIHPNQDGRTNANAVTVEMADSEHYERVAKRLFDIGFNGPRHGGIPTTTGNLMCEAAEIIALLLGNAPIMPKIHSSQGGR